MIRYYKPFLLTCLLFFNIFFFPCTDILLTSEDDNIVIARTMDFSITMPTALYSRTKGSIFKTHDQNKKKSTSWKTLYNYAFLGIDDNKTEDDHLNWGFDGINEKGLAVEILWHKEAKYNEINDKNKEKAIFLGDLVDLLLGQCKNIEEATNFLKEHVFWLTTNQSLSNILPTVHLMISDISKKSIVIEFIKGKTKIYPTNQGILANSPSYNFHLEHLRNYVQMTNLDTEDSVINGDIIKATSHGTGLYNIPGDFTSPSRFIKTCMLKNYSKKPETIEDLLVLATSIIGNVTIPLYAIIEKKDNKILSDFTQWTILKDLKNLIFYIKDTKHVNFKKIDLKVLWEKEATNTIPMKKLFEYEFIST